ncbi:MAG: hypothetical protein ACK5LV_05840 [Lachnospirales bacterium]
MFTKGQIVFSKMGRDKGKAFIIVDVLDNEETVYLCDGKHHKLCKPKKKNVKHIQKTNYIDKEIGSLLEDEGYIQDAMLRRALLPYVNKLF